RDGGSTMLGLLAALALQIGPTVVLPPPPPPQQQLEPVRFGGAKIVHVDSGGQSETCLSPAVARGARIVAVGTYEGGLPTAGIATDEGHQVKAVAIGAARSGPPLVLILSAYDPVIWDLRRVPNERIRAVYVSGYHVQSVAGARGRPVR